MNYLSSLLSATLILAPLSTASGSEYTTHENHVISDVVLSFSSSDSYNFPAKQSILLKNCTIEDFSQELSDRISQRTEEITISDGTVPRAYVKRTLTAFTSLDSGTSEVVIEPVDNFNLKLLDVHGALRAIPNNIHYLRRLVVLNLCGNNIEQVNLDQFQGQDYLRTLNLGHNRIKYIQLTKNLSLPALTELFLHGNLLTTLDLAHLGAANLQRFYVSQNQLTRIGGFPERYTELVRADLYSNKWNCGWLEATLAYLNAAQVETLSFLPDGVCNEKGSAKIKQIECEAN